MPDAPIDRLDQAIDALEAVYSLLIGNNSGNMHLVCPDTLGTLLRIILCQLRDAISGLAPQT
jgi:hypothetical protein